MLQPIDHGPVRELRLDRPPANALSPELLGALAEAVRGAPGAGAHALVLSGAPGMFSAGLDVPAFVELDRPAVAGAWRGLFDVMEALLASPVPVAAALTGHAPAGGCVLALCCEHRVLARGPYRIGLNEVRVGVPMPEPIWSVAAHVLGPRRAQDLCLRGALLGGEEALDVGLVDELADADEVLERALAWARDLLELPRETLRRTRATCAAAPLRSLRSLDERALEDFLDHWFGSECQTALRALVARLQSSRG